MIGLVDGNNFFVSCERIFAPRLEKRPVAVLSNNDGCVISRSNEFKALGISMGTPYFELRDRKDLTLLSSNYELYADISRRVIAVLHEFSPDIEQYSIDEAFIHATATDYYQFGLDIRSTILKWVGIPCGVGFAPTKTLAKIANHIGKKSLSGVFVMREQDIPDILSRLPVSEVWGVGRRLAPKLMASGIRTAWQLAMADQVRLRQRFNVSLAKTALELRGESVIGHEDAETLSQSITCSRSFGRPVIDLEELKESVSTYAAKAAEKLRSERQTATGVNVYFQYYPEYQPYSLPGGMTSLTVMFEQPLSATGPILSAVLPKLDQIYIPDRRYKKSGVVFFGLESAIGQVQGDLFAVQERDEKNERLSVALDNINQKFGKGTLFHLGEGIEKRWSMKRDMLSKPYTTDWKSLLEVR